MSCPSCGHTLIFIWRNGWGERVHTCVTCGFTGIWRRSYWFTILKGASNDLVPTRP